MQISSDVRKAIDYIFQPRHNIKQILEYLEESADETRTSPEVAEWAKKTRKTIEQRSPTSVKVALRQIRDGARWNIMQTFRHEYHIATKFMEHPDFVEGVSARLIQKPPGKPNWSPATMDEVSDETVDSFFAADPTELALLSAEGANPYQDYPHAWVGLPWEKEVKTFIENNTPKDPRIVVRHFLNEKKNKIGVKEKIEEILVRKTSIKDGSLVWE